ncbi:MAG: hypothetical protein KA116_07135 [Proteobacteria bacterium]|nr:hypothetical protein [Pseudomonadota bacterium]
MKKLLFLSLASMVSIEKSWSQAGPGGGTPSTVDTSQSAADALAERERALQLSQQISSINNSYNDQETSINSQISQAKLAKAQCTTTYEDAKTAANSQAEQTKSSALSNLMSGLMGPATQMLGNSANSESKKSKASFENEVNAYNSAAGDVEATLRKNGKAVNGIPTLSTSDPASVESMASLSTTQLKNACNEIMDTAQAHGGTLNSQAFIVANRDSQNCLASVKEMETHFNNAKTQATNVKDGKSAQATTLATTAIVAGAGLWGYNTQKKGAESTKEAALDSAENTRDACIDGYEQQISDLEKQLATLDSRRDEEIDFARQAAGLAEDYANLNSNTSQGPDPTPNLPINPDSLLNSNDNLLLSGAKINDPTLPSSSDGSGDNNNSNSNAANQAANGAGGGGAGGGGGGEATPPNWTFGSPYPGNVGGGGLPEQPGSGTFTAEGGGFPGGFNSAEDAFASFDPNSDYGDGESSGGSGGAGDGGLLLMMKRARQRLTAHAAELLAPNNYNAIARKDPQPNAPDSKRKAASLSRL